MIATTTAPTSTGREDKDEGRLARRNQPEDRLPVSALVCGLIDARACHIDFLQTIGGQEVERWYRRHRQDHRRTVHQVAPTVPAGGVSPHART